MVEFENFTQTIWFYKSDGIAIYVDLPQEENGSFRCNFFNYIGKRSLFAWPGKEEGALPF